MNQHHVFRRIAALVAVPLALLLCATAALADTVYIRNPLDYGGTIVTNNWDHGASYGERSLDIVPPCAPSCTVGTSVFWRADNVDPVAQVYYDVAAYPSPSGCTGVTFWVYRHLGADYAYIGSAHYLHIQNYSTGRSHNIDPGTSESFTVGNIAPTQCGSTGPHLHHGHNSSDGFLDASWITTSTGMTSSDITLYK